MELSSLNIDQFCSSINLDCDEVAIDLSDITFFRPFALVYLGLFLRYNNSKGKSFRVIPPKNSKAANYLTIQKFWERFNITPDKVRPDFITLCDNATSLNDIVAIDMAKLPFVDEEISEAIAKVLQNNRVDINIGSFTELVSELVHNFKIHSGSQCECAAATMQLYPNMKEIVFAIGDCGCGIRHTLSGNPLYEYLAKEPHYQSAIKAFELLVSCRPDGGMGLTDVKDAVLELNGSVTLTTGDGYVVYSRSGQWAGSTFYDLPGVQIGFVVPLPK